METNLRNQSYNNNFAAGWDGILELPNHGLAICFDTEKAKVVKEYLQKFSHSLWKQGIKLFFQFLYTGSQVHQGNLYRIYLMYFWSLAEYRTLVVGDFSLDQLLYKNIQMLDFSKNYSKITKNFNSFSIHVLPHMFMEEYWTLFCTMPNMIQWLGLLHHLVISLLFLTHVVFKQALKYMLAPYCMEYPHTMPFLRYKILQSQLKPSKPHAFQGVCAIPNALNLEIFFVKHHNCALLLDFLALFCNTVCMP